MLGVRNPGHGALTESRGKDWSENQEVIEMNRRGALLWLASGVVVPILTVPAQQAIAAKAKDATARLEIRGIV